MNSYTNRKTILICHRKPTLNLAKYDETPRKTNFKGKWKHSEKVNQNSPSQKFLNNIKKLMLSGKKECFLEGLL